MGKGSGRSLSEARLNRNKVIKINAVTSVDFAKFGTGKIEMGWGISLIYHHFNRAWVGKNAMAKRR